MRERLKKVVERKAEFDFMVKTYKRDMPEIHARVNQFSESLMTFITELTVLKQK